MSSSWRSKGAGNRKSTSAGVKYIALSPAAVKTNIAHSPKSMTGKYGSIHPVMASTPGRSRKRAMASEGPSIIAKNPMTNRSSNAPRTDLAPRNNRRKLALIDNASSLERAGCKGFSVRDRSEINRLEFSPLRTAPTLPWHGRRHLRATPLLGGRRTATALRPASRRTAAGPCSGSAGGCTGLRRVRAGES